MGAITVNGYDIATDKEGYLKNIDQWSLQIAAVLAEQEHILITDNHLEIINLLRNFYLTYQMTPSMRVFVKIVSQDLDQSKGNSIYLTTLFPKGVLKQACKIAGLPKPTNCV